MNQKHPSKWAIKFLRWFCKEESIDEIEGDLFEMFYKRSSQSGFKAQCFLFWNVLRSFRRENLKTVQWVGPFWGISWIQSIRYLKRDGVYTFLNALSLAIGFTLTILFTWYAHEELTYDQFHHQKNRIFRVSFDQFLDLGAYATTSYPIGPALKEDFPEVSRMTRFGGIGQLTVRYEERAFLELVNTADEDFFQIFDFKLLEGDPKSVLSDPNQIVISRRMADKYFPGERAVGKKLSIGSSGSYDSVITGVFEDPPPNSHIETDFIMSYATMHKLYDYLGTLWEQMPRNHTYVLLESQVEAASFQEKLTHIQNTYVTELERGGYDLMLIPLDEVHFYEGLINEYTSNRDFNSLITFGMVVALILFIGVINYTNITSSRYLTRIREVGVRKVLGAGKTQLLAQMLFQSFLMVLFSLVLAVVALIFVLPLFNDLAGKSFDGSYLLQMPTIYIIGGLMLGVTLIAGIFPAVKIVSIQFITPSQTESRFVPGRSGWARSSLLIFQYLITFALMVSSVVIYQQLTYLESKVDPGEAARIIVPLNVKLSEDLMVLQEGLAQYPYIQSTAASSHVPSYYGDSWPVQRSLGGTPVQTENFVITENYLDIMSYNLLTGRYLNAQLESDRKGAFIINETCATMLGFSSLEEALGETIYWGSDEPKKGTIIGISEDFHFESFHDKINPALFQFSPYDWMDYNFLIMEVLERDVVKAIKAAEMEVAQIDPNWIVDASIFEEHFKQRYMAETSQGKLATGLTIVAIILTCLGQIGLILHFALSHKKELAIRKVLGATVQQLWFLMTRSYFRFMTLAIVIGVPCCIYLMNSWLEDFYYRIELGWFPFLVSAFAAFLVMILVVSTIAVKSAYLNPVDSLSEE